MNEEALAHWGLSRQKAKNFNEYIEFNESNVHNFLPNRILHIRTVCVYTAVFNSRNSIKYLRSAQNLISSWFVTLKYTLMIHGKVYIRS